MITQHDSSIHKKNGIQSWKENMRTSQSLKRFIQLSACIALIGMSPLHVHAQWTKVPAADVPRGPNGKPNLAAPVPRLADGRPDLSGIWESDAGYNQNLGKDLKEGVPYQS